MLSLSLAGTTEVLASLPSAWTEEADFVTSTSAHLNGIPMSTGGQTCQYRFRYKKSGGSYSYTPWGGDLPPYTGRTRRYTQTVSGLTPGARYYFNAQLKNSDGESSWANEMAFTTLPEITTPVAKTQEATEIGPTSARLWGTVLIDGGAPCQYSFQCRKAGGKSSTHYSTWTGSVTTGESFSEVITGLEPDSTYYFSAAVKNSARQSSSTNEQTFTTPCLLAIECFPHGEAPLSDPIDVNGFTEPSLPNIEVELYLQEYDCSLGRFSDWRVVASCVSDANGEFQCTLVPESIGTFVVKAKSGDLESDGAALRVFEEFATGFVPSENGFAFKDWGLSQIGGYTVGGHCLGMSLASAAYYSSGMALPALGTACNASSVPPDPSCDTRIAIDCFQAFLLLPQVWERTLLPLDSNPWASRTLNPGQYSRLETLILCGSPTVLLVGDQAVTAYKIRNYGCTKRVCFYDPNDGPEDDNSFILMQEGDCLTMSGYASHDRFMVFNPSISLPDMRTCAAAGLTFTFDCGRDIYDLGEPILLGGVVVCDTCPYPEASMEAQVQTPVGTESVTLFDDGLHNDANDGDGIYANFFTHTAAEGEYRITATASGLCPFGESFSQQATRTVRVQGLPDLIPVDLAVSRGPAQGQMTLSAQVWNDGTREANEIVVALYDMDDPNKPPIGADLAIDCLDPGETKEVSTTWNGPDGDHTVGVIVDCHNAITEADEMNNVLRTAFTTDAQPTAHWKLDDAAGTNAGDSAGASAGAVFGARWSQGHLGGALRFDGMDDYVDCGNAPGLAPQQMTIAFWVYLEGTVSYQYILGKARDLGWEQTDYLFYTGGDGRLLCRFGGDPSRQAVVQSATGLALGRWAHVVAIRDGSTAALYLDGRFEGSTTYAFVPTAGNQALRIGSVGSAEGWAGFFKGMIDDVRIYDQPLSTPEIQRLFSRQ